MTKRALCIGINEYKKVGGLRGCLNDVQDMHALLRTNYGFENSEIRVLTDSRATKAAIEARLQWLVKGAKPGDQLVYYAAGHGTRLRDRDGDELTDSMDELFCPYDMDWDGTYITDDDLGRCFDELPQGVSLECFLDTCHSATAMRAVVSPEQEIRPRYLEPPIDIALRAVGQEDRLRRRPLLRAAERPEGVTPIVWSGCQDNQTSADARIQGEYRGAFTHWFTHHLRSQPNLSRDELLERVRTSLSAGGFSQLPQLQADSAGRRRAALAKV